MKYFKMKEIFKDEVCIGGKASGAALAKKIDSALMQGPVTMDFVGIDLVTQGFSDEFLSRLLGRKGERLFEVLKFKDCSDGVRIMLTSTANRFLKTLHSIET